MVTLLKDVIVFCKRNVYSLGLDLDMKGSRRHENNNF